MCVKAGVSVTKEVVKVNVAAVDQPKGKMFSPPKADPYYLI